MAHHDPLVALRGARAVGARLSPLWQLYSEDCHPPGLAMFAVQERGVHRGGARSPPGPRSCSRMAKWCTTRTRFFPGCTNSSPPQRAQLGLQRKTPSMDLAFSSAGKSGLGRAVRAAGSRTPASWQRSAMWLGKEAVRAGRVIYTGCISNRKASFKPRLSLFSLSLSLSLSLSPSQLLAARAFIKNSVSGTTTAAKPIV